MKKILHQYELKAKGLIFGDTTQVMPLITQLLEDNPTLHGPFTESFDTLVDVHNKLWFGQKKSDFFFILAPAHYVLSSFGAEFLQDVKQYNDVSADIHEKRFIFADVYNWVADSLKHDNYICLSFNSMVHLRLNVCLEYTKDFGPVTVIGPESMSLDVTELFVVQDRPPSPYIRAPKPEDSVPFKYLCDPYRADQNIFKLNALREDKCGLCRKAHAYLYVVCEELICPLCFKNRKAYRFDPVITALESNSEPVIKLTREQKSELARTPIFPSWQDPIWKVCCHEYCQFIQRMDAKDIAEASPPIQRVIMNYLGSRADFLLKIMSKIDGPTGYLFQCLTCKEYHFYHDTD